MRIARCGPTLAGVASLLICVVRETVTNIDRLGELMRSAFILAGGLGARLRPHTLILPKPLMPLGRETILERLLRNIASAEPTNVTISLGYLGHLVEAVIQDGSSAGLSVTYTREPEPLGTAGALALLPYDLQDDDVLLVLNGDTLTNLDFGELLDWFESEDATAAMVCVHREVLIDYGVVQSSESGELLGISEKPRVSHMLSTGINLFRGRALRELPSGRVDMPDFLTSLADSGHRVLCRETDALWLDLGRAEDLIAANDLVESGGL